MCMGLVSQLKNAGVIPVIVFDGRDIQAKANTNEKREKYVII